MARTIGIDFGTTNSVIALTMPDGRIDTAIFTLDDETIRTFRTVLCFWSENRRAGNTLRHASGPRAIRA